MDLAILRSDYAFDNRLINGGMVSFVEKGVYSNKAHTRDGYYWRDMGLQDVGYDQGWNILHPDPADYGMTGEAALIVKK